MSLPASWVAVRRPSDDELVGFLVPDGEDYRPATVFGYVLGPATSEAEARAVLIATGLDLLDERWVLVHESVDRPTLVEIAEASPERVVVQTLYYAMSGGRGSRWQLPVPLEGALLRQADLER
jgi:hypothetical protein